MYKDIKKYVGLDVHKDSIVVSVADAGRAPARLIGTIKHDMAKLDRALSKLGEPDEIHVVYEAGPTGYGLLRHLHKRGYSAEVIAPSKTPQRAGDRIKTDRRDSRRLAELSRAGELTAIWIPDPADEAIRDLSRAREDAVKSRMQARLQLKGFLLRHDLRYPGKTSWTKSFYAWLGTLSFGQAGQQIAFTEYTLAVQAGDQRVARLTQAVGESIEGWRFEPVVQALLALRGVDVVTAVGLTAEIGDISRFAHPRQLMSYLGLVPSESSSGERTRRGSITKTGNSHARRLLVEAAWNYRFGPRINVRAQARARDLPEQIRATGWKAQQRLCGRYARLRERGVQGNKVCVAVARELAGFVWAIAQQAQQPNGQAK
jgi:transposase